MRALVSLVALLTLVSCGGKGGPSSPSGSSSLNITLVHFAVTPNNNSNCNQRVLPSNCTALIQDTDGTYPFRNGATLYVVYIEFTTTCGKTIETTYTNTANIDWAGGPINAPGAPHGFASEVICSNGGGPNRATSFEMFAPQNGQVFTTDGRRLTLAPGFEFTITAKLRELANGLEPVEWSKDYRMKYTP